MLDDYFGFGQRITDQDLEHLNTELLDAVSDLPILDGDVLDIVPNDLGTIEEIEAIIWILFGGWQNDLD